MSNLQDLINLAKSDGGKFFVIDERGDAKLVIMSVEEYQKMLLGKLQKQILDVERINREITKAQLSEETSGVQPRSERSSATGVTKAQLREQEFSKPGRAPQVPAKNSLPPRVDLRAEVIDPSFDFENPKAEIDDL